MGCLATATVLSSLPNNSRSTPLARHHASGVRRINDAPPPLQKSLNKKRQPSVAEVQKAIGAGVQRDNDSSIKRGDSAFMDMMLSSPFAQPEGSAERKLREVGEWVIDRTEKSPRSGLEQNRNHLRIFLTVTVSGRNMVRHITVGSPCPDVCQAACVHGKLPVVISQTLIGPLTVAVGEILRGSELARACILASLLGRTFDLTFHLCKGNLAVTIIIVVVLLVMVDAGQHILMALCLKILPVWLLLLLITSGLIKLPFDTPFLDDLIM